jgi:hypothetical protein
VRQLLYLIMYVSLSRSVGRLRTESTSIQADSTDLRGDYRTKEGGQLPRLRSGIDHSPHVLSCSIPLPLSTVNRSIAQSDMSVAKEERDLLSRSRDFRRDMVSDLIRSATDDSSHHLEDG